MKLQIGGFDRGGMLMLFIVAFASLLSGVESLQCFNCRGVSYYDPDFCFYPVRGKTVRQECRRGEVCETRIHKGERIEEVIERGCTNACNDRTFVWTDYFQVYCCDTNECNAANNIPHSLPVILFGLLTVLYIRYTNHR